MKRHVALMRTIPIKNMFMPKPLKGKLDSGGCNLRRRLLIRLMVSGFVGICSQAAMANSPSPAVKEEWGGVGLRFTSFRDLIPLRCHLKPSASYYRSAGEAPGGTFTRSLS